MPEEADSIIVTNPRPPESPKGPLFAKIAFLLITLIGLVGTLSLVANKPWQRFFPKVPQEDPTLQSQEARRENNLWLVYLTLETTTKKVELKEEPRIMPTDHFPLVISEPPQPQEGEWAFKVTVENQKGEVIYASYRLMSIFPSKTNPKIWDFGVAVPYTQGARLRIFDLEENPLFVTNL